MIIDRFGCRVFFYTQSASQIPSDPHSAGGVDLLVLHHLEIQIWRSFLPSSQSEASVESLCSSWWYMCFHPERTWRHLKIWEDPPLISLRSALTSCLLLSTFWRNRLISAPSLLLDSTRGNWLEKPGVAVCRALKRDTTQSHFNKNNPCVRLPAVRISNALAGRRLRRAAYSAAAVASHYSSKLKFGAKWLNSLPHNISGNNKWK